MNPLIELMEGVRREHSKPPVQVIIITKADMDVAQFPCMHDAVHISITAALSHNAIAYDADAALSTRVQSV